MTELGTKEDWKLVDKMNKEMALKVKQLLEKGNNHEHIANIITKGSCQNTILGVSLHRKAEEILKEKIKEPAYFNPL